MNHLTGLIVAGSLVPFLGAAPAAAYNLPDHLPARKPGLWESVTTGMAGPNRVEIVKRYCLDAATDRLLQTVFMQGREVAVVHSDISCHPPALTLSGNVMTGEMLCRTNSTTDSETAGNDFLWTTTFKSDTDVVVERHYIARDVMFAGEDRTVDRQTWIGDCEPGQQPGDGVDVSGDFGLTSNAPPRRTNLLETSKVLDKILREGKELNRRAGPM